MLRWTTRDFLKGNTWLVEPNDWKSLSEDATELIITGRMMNADEALQTGLVTRGAARRMLLRQRV